MSWGRQLTIVHRWWKPAQPSASCRPTPCDKDSHLVSALCLGGVRPLSEASFLPCPYRWHLRRVWIPPLRRQAALHFFFLFFLNTGRTIFHPRLYFPGKVGRRAGGQCGRASRAAATYDSIEKMKHLAFFFFRRAKLPPPAPPRKNPPPYSLTTSPFPPLLLSQLAIHLV